MGIKPLPMHYYLYLFFTRYVFAAAGGGDPVQTDSIQFQMLFHEAINKFTQNWPVYDIIPSSYPQVCNHSLSLSLSVPLQFVGLIFTFVAVFLLHLFVFQWSRFPCIPQQPQSVFERASFYRF